MKKTLLFLIISLHSFSLYSVNKWFLAVKKNDNGFYSSLNDYTPIFPPDGKFYADPMLFKYNGTNYVFFEDYDYKKGVISFITVDRDLNVSAPIKILELDTHLSFPLIFQEGEHIYMVPESCNAHEVALYQAENFPYDWKKKRVLLPCSGIDSVLFKYNGYYWIFTTLEPSEVMQIYYSESLSSEFKPHAINSKKIQGRNAGNFFVYNGSLIRPVMNSQISYGHHMVLKEIVTLTPDEFEEREIYTINPTWAPRLKGTHTFNYNEDLIVYDGKMVDEPFPKKNDPRFYQKINVHEREWMDKHYFPVLEGRVLFVGVACYNANHYKQVKNPKLFETIDFDPRNAGFGSPYKHYVEDFLTFEPGYLYDHISIFGVLARHDDARSGELYNIDSQKKVTAALLKANQLLKPNGTLLLGPDIIATKPGTKNVPHLNVNYWYDRFEKAPLDQYEPIFLGIGDQNFVWWGRKAAK